MGRVKKLTEFVIFPRNHSVLDAQVLRMALWQAFRSLEKGGFPEGSVTMARVWVKEKKIPVRPRGAGSLVECLWVPQLGALVAFFGWEGSETKTDYRKKKGTLILTSLLEDLVAFVCIWRPGGSLSLKCRKPRWPSVDMAATCQQGSC